MSTPGSGTTLLVSDVGERGLIERIRRRVPAAPSDLLVGIGDDAAVAKPDRGSFHVLTTDALVEGIHFDRRFSSPSDIGYKSLAVNVSDVAAMGGTPRLALLSLILPADLPMDAVDGLLDGWLEAARASRVTLAGGNITRSPGPLIVDVTLVGAVRPRKILTRGGGRAGDVVYVSGEIGAGVAGLGWLQTSAKSPVDEPDDPLLRDCVLRYRRPEPRQRLGQLLGRTKTASACMDLSDGLADGIRQIVEASGTGATVEASRIPLHPAARTWLERHSEDPVFAALSGGDDYELVFTISRRRLKRLRSIERLLRGVRVTPIGELTAGTGIHVDRNGRLEPLPTGFVHF